MKTSYKAIFALFIIVVVVCSFACCSDSLKAGKPFYLYQYDASSDRFVKVGASVVFGKNLESYTYVFNDGTLSIHGSVSHSDDPSSYTLHCSEDVVPVVVEKYREYLISSGASDSTMELFNFMSEHFTPETQLLSYKKFLFTARSVELVHSVSAGDNASSFEGEFTMTATGEKLKFKGGSVYSPDEKGDFTIYEGYYSVSNGILTFTNVDEKGNDKYEDGVLYRKRYLMATVSFSDDFSITGTDFEEQLEDADWVKRINSELSAYSGKTVAVLSDEFYSYEMK